MSSNKKTLANKKVKSLIKILNSILNDIENTEYSVNNYSKEHLSYSVDKLKLLLEDGKPFDDNKYSKFDKYKERILQTDMTQNFKAKFYKFFDDLEEIELERLDKIK